jgi:DNA-binding NtrC family response regulator
LVHTGGSDIFVDPTTYESIETGLKSRVIRAIAGMPFARRMCRVAPMSSLIPAAGGELHRVFETLLRTADVTGTGPSPTLREMLESVEKAALVDALVRTNGNRARAARVLGTTERVFNYGVRKYAIDWRSYKR